MLQPAMPGARTGLTGSCYLQYAMAGQRCCNRPGGMLEPRPGGAATVAQESWNRAGCWRVLQPWRPDAGTRINFCFHRRFGFAETSTAFVFFVTIVLYFAGTSVNFCYHGLFDLLEPTLNYASLLSPAFWFAGTSLNFCYHQVLVRWNGVRFLIFLLQPVAGKLQRTLRFATTTTMKCGQRGPRTICFCCNLAPASVAGDDGAHFFAATGQP